MMKKLINMFWLAVVACAASGCSDNESLGGDDNALRCQGRLGIDGVASAAVVSRAEAGKVDLATLCGLQVPQREELKLTLTGKDIQPLVADETGKLIPDPNQPKSDYECIWPTLAVYDEPPLYPGVYTALLEYGDPDAIGPAKPYYRGEKQATVEVSKETLCEVEVKIVNSAVRIAATDNFKNYFSDAQFQLYLNDDKDPLKNDAGETIVFTLADTDAPIFMPAGTRVVVKGSVRRPSQTTVDDADGELLPIDVPVRTTAAGTLHTFRFTAQAGDAHVEVEFEDFGEGSGADVELNDDAIRDEPAPDSGESGSGTPDEGASENAPAE